MAQIKIHHIGNYLVIMVKSFPFAPLRHGVFALKIRAHPWLNRLTLVD
jgi:hypothetical protein